MASDDQKPDSAGIKAEAEIGPTLVISRPEDLLDDESQVPLEPGTLVDGDYRIHSVAAIDHASITYRAEDMQLGIPVALKEYFPAGVASRDGEQVVFEAPGSDEHETALSRFIREAQTLVRFHHSNVVRAHRVFEANNSAYIVLDFEQGQSLRDWYEGLARAPSQSELDRITVPLLAALSAVHGAGVLHRDIRPANILIRSSGAPVLCGFGSARIASAAVNTKSIVVASDYTAPEVAAIDHARQGPCTDIYGLAATLYELVTGNRPDSGAARLVKDSLRPAKTAAAPGYRDEFLDAIDAALRVDSLARPQSVDAWDAIRPPHGLAEPLPDTVVREQPAPSPASQAAISHGQPEEAMHTRLTAFATRVSTHLETLPDPGDLLSSSSERFFQPVALVSAFAGLALYATQASFGIAAILIVLSIALLFLHGFLPMHRFINSSTSKQSAIINDAESATHKGTWSMFSILLLMALLPLIASRLLPPNPDAPIELLSLIVGVPTMVMLLFALSKVPVQRGWLSLLFGVANILIVLFVLFIWTLNLIVMAEQQNNADAIGQFNRYVYVLAPIAAAALGVYVFLCRMSARQRLRHSV